MPTRASLTQSDRAAACICCGTTQDQTRSLNDTALIQTSPPTFPGGINAHFT